MKTSACLVLGLVALVLGGCGGGETGSSSATPADDGPATPATTVETSSPPPSVVVAGACILTIEYQGNRYFETAVEVVPREAEPLGTGVIPDCNDTGGEPGPGDEVEVSALAGVPPEVALFWPGRPESVLVREGFENRLPAALRQEAPTCDPTDEPIRLAGPWFGIWGRGDLEDVDLTASYEVKLFAAKSSAPRYERAFLLVRVPAGLERSLTRDNLRWLWDGTIAVTAACRDGRYLAESVAAHPPD